MTMEMTSSQADHLDVPVDKTDQADPHPRQASLLDAQPDVPEDKADLFPVDQADQDNHQPMPAGQMDVPPDVQDDQADQSDNNLQTIQPLTITRVGCRYVEFPPNNDNVHLLISPTTGTERKADRAEHSPTEVIDDQDHPSTTPHPPSHVDLARSGHVCTPTRPPITPTDADKSTFDEVCISQILPINNPIPPPTTPQTPRHVDKARSGLVCTPTEPPTTPAM